MKIVHVLPALTKGGGERVMAELANHASRSGHEVTVLAACPVDSSLLQDSLEEEIQVVFIRSSAEKKLLWYFSIFAWIWKKRSWLKGQDVVHSHMTYGAVFCTILWFYLKLFRVDGPIVVETCHSAGAPIHPLRRKFYEMMMKSRHAFALIAQDDGWKRFTSKNPDIPSRIILNGVADPSKGPVSEEQSKKYGEGLGLNKEISLVVGTVGMLRADRQPWLFVPIFTEIAKACPEVRFIIAGGGPEQGRIQTLFEDSGILDRVHLTGTVSDSRYPLSLMDLYISLNVGPVTGLAGMEASMAGVPIIGLQWISQYETNPNDWIWSSCVQLEVAQKAVALIKSEKQRRELAGRQQQFLLEHLTVEAMADSYYDLYKLAGNRRPHNE